MIETLKKKIDDAEYAVTQFPGRAAFKLKTKIILSFGPALAAALSGVSLKPKAGVSASDLDVGSIGNALTKIAVDSDEFMDLILEILGSTRKDGKEITPELFDMEFAGNLQTVYKVVGFVLEVNFGSFFGKGGIGELMTRFQRPTPPQEG